MTMRQQLITQEAGHTVITQNAPDANVNRFSNSAINQMKGLSITQIVIGGLCVIFGIALILLKPQNFDLLFGEFSLEESYTPKVVIGKYGYGIWLGCYFILVGAVGLGAARSSNEGVIVAAMILNILCSSGPWLVLMSFSSAAIAEVNTFRLWQLSYNSHDRGILALNSIMLIMALAELVITIWSAALCCGAVCRCCRGDPSPLPTQVVVTQHHVTVPSITPTQAPVSVYNIGQQYPPKNQSYAYPAPIHHQPAGGYIVTSY